ncbi:MAG: hypothetical protein Tsb0018_08800 [Opitutales bacterium]|tara:strand:- start:5035 stop:5484 length:450 start_codon:yes stop_codon:yes gene_type:complete
MDTYPAGNTEFSCILVDEAPCIEVDGQTFDSLAKLLKNYPYLAEQENLDTYCRLSNFFFTGVLYTVIDHPETFSERYSRQVEEVQDAGGIRQAPFGPFDISEVKEPQITEGVLTFYVEDTYNHIPYRVKAPYPYTDSKVKAQYELLPQA